MTADEAKNSLQQSPLRIGVSSRALFSLEQENRIFHEKGVAAYCQYQLDNEDEALPKGSAFPVIERLLALNDTGTKPVVEVILMSKNSPDLSLRAFNSIENYQLPIKLGSFTSGRSLAPFVNAWGIDLFLSNDPDDVAAAVKAGSAAAKLGNAPLTILDDEPGEVRIAFDGDAVLFSPESDEIYKQHGLEAFLKHETQKATEPMSGGPLGSFLKKLSLLRLIHLDQNQISKVRLSIVTARNAPAHKRVIHTLRAWGTPVDEAHFVGANVKGPILKASRAHIFFDDQEKHILGAAQHVAAGHVPGPHDTNDPIIPAG
ncbi:5'-nucleotidase [Ochrobactrum sp. CDB2]|uniref:5'-nucleotidase n=1 Tax=Brucella pseudogrignonensis TaxID=419475 RepID=A0A7Y3WXZ7_9HYPH|nr:5'-nucleotidase [Brucella pseudogrignonensis]EMG53628.1 5'-nucleotidase [Ochrobactrum sp. CDB2]NNV21733.1 5'-nucleotidase [Brucella pseudogrignonensis]